MPSIVLVVLDPPPHSDPEVLTSRYSRSFGNVRLSVDQMLFDPHSGLMQASAIRRRFLRCMLSSCLVIVHVLRRLVDVYMPCTFNRVGGAPGSTLSLEEHIKETKCAMRRRIALFSHQPTPRCDLVAQHWIVAGWAASTRTALIGAVLNCNGPVTCGCAFWRSREF